MQWRHLNHGIVVDLKDGQEIFHPTDPLEKDGMVLKNSASLSGDTEWVNEGFLAMG